METNEKTNKLAWLLIAVLVLVLLFMSLFSSCNEPKIHKIICYPTKDSVECDTFVNYEIVSLFGFDTCCKFKLKDTSEIIICGEYKITEIK